VYLATVLSADVVITHEVGTQLVLRNAGSNPGACMPWMDEGINSFDGNDMETKYPEEN